MSTFTYTSRYSEYSNCFFQIGKYANGNLAIEIWSNEEGPITKVTVNPDIYIDHDRIAVKDYSENEGMADWLISENLIEEEPIESITSGFVKIPIYELTPHGKEMFGV